MNASDFTVARDSRKRVSYSYTDPATGRHFGVRVRTTATDMEVVTGKTKAVKGARDGVRYFLEEYVPNGRLCREDAKGDPVEFIDVPAAKWAKAKAKPSTAWKAIRDLMAANPGFDPIMWGSGYGTSSIFYATLEECAGVLTNALDTDMWAQSHEPEKHIVLAERVLASFEAKALLDRLPGGEQIMAAALEIGAALAPTEKAVLGEHLGNLRIDATDSRLEHPACCRLFLMFNPTGQVEPKNNFYRGAWGPLANRIAGRELPNYDGPAGISHGFPAYGQAFGASVRPPEVKDIEVLHKMEGTTNKVYLYAEVGGKRFFGWGRFDKGKFQTKAAGGGSYGQMSAKRDKGYDRIDAESVPDIWARLLEAARDFD